MQLKEKQMQYDNNKPFEKKEKEGYLWHETESKVIRKGSILLKKADGYDGKDDELYASIIKTNVNGQDKYELCISVGLLYINDDESKRTENSPDISGPITINNVAYKCGGWQHVSEKNGREYTKVQLTPKAPKTSF